MIYKFENLSKDLLIKQVLKHLKIILQMMGREEVSENNQIVFLSGMIFDKWKLLTSLLLMQPRLCWCFRIGFSCTAGTATVVWDISMNIRAKMIRATCCS